MQKVILKNTIKEPNIGINIIELSWYDYFFEKIKPVLLDKYSIIANLETPLVDIKNTPKPIFSFSTQDMIINKDDFKHWSDSKRYSYDI